MPMPNRRLHRSYVVPGTDITTGKGGASQIRKPQVSELFPDSSCITKATLWTSDDTGLGVVVIYFKKETSGNSIYSYEGTAVKVKQDFQSLVTARDQAKSVGKVYIEVFKNGDYPPSLAIA
jgi:hypothetical protein